MPRKNTINFLCDSKVIQIPFLEEYKEEITDKNPIIRRVFLHGDHAHLLRIDSQSVARNNEKFDLYHDDQKSTEGILIRFSCPECNKFYEFRADKLKSQESKEVDEFGIPSLEKFYQCFHLHGDKNSKHVVHFRIDQKGEIKMSKVYKIAL